MILQSIKLVNFGLYCGEHEIQLAHKQDKPITLIGGLNGRGKTTLLDSITLGLYGRRALKYLQDERIKYSSYLNNHINKNAPYGSMTSITITLADSEQTTDVITICRAWEKRYKQIPEEVLTATRNGIEDEYLSQNWDYFVEEILPLNISRFFFFDNEKIAQIADDESFDLVKDSIRSLLGLTTIDQLITDMAKLTKRSQSEDEDSESNKIAAEIDYLQTQISKCDENAKAAYDEAAHYQSLIVRTRKLFDEESELFWKAGGNLGLERSRLQSELQELEAKMKLFEEEAMQSVCDSFTPLILCVPQLNNIQNKQTSEELRRKRKYYIEVLEQLKTILETQSAYSDIFKNEALTFINDAKIKLCPEIETSNINRLSEEASHQLMDILKTYPQKLNSIISLLTNIETNRKNSVQIESHLAREVNDAETHKIWKKMMELNDIANQHEISKKLADEKLHHIEREREMYISRRGKLISDSFNLQKTHGEVARLIRYSQIVMQTMEVFKERLTEMRVHDLSDKILECFTAMVGKASMIHHVQINPQTLDIKLIDFSNKELLKSQLSAGEKQLFAISIIWGLAKCSGYDMPVVIDTPLGRLDSQHRQHFVEGYLPYASKQVVVLSTDEEINGRYLDLIVPYVNKAYTLVYDEETRSSTIVSGYFGGELK